MMAGKAKEVPRIRIEGRTDLSKAIPLDTPIHIFIDPSSACNFHCKFCFDHKEAHHQIMKMDLFKKVIDDCKAFPKRIKAIRLYGFGEPLLNRNLPEMVKYIKDTQVTDFVEFTTNGWWLNPELNLNLINAGLDAITISVPGVTGPKIKEVCGRDVDFKKYVDNVKHFYNHKSQCRVHCKITNYDLCQHDKLKFYRVFQNICDEISVDNIVPIWPGMKNEGEVIRDQKKNIYNLPINEVSVCPYIFYHMTVNANGMVSTCFVDYAQQSLIGDVNTESIVDIWNGETLKQLRVDMLHGIKHGICRGCPQLKYGQADNIGDPKVILKRLLK